jgi:hypothetical protein
MPEDVRAGEEPRRTLYTPEWDEAQKRLAMLRGLEGGERLARLLAHLEAGWTLLRPLELLAERALAAGAEGALADAAGFVDVSVLDHFRGVADDCVRMVPGHARHWRRVELDAVESELGWCARNLRILRMAADGPAFPADLRPAVEAAGAAFPAWHAEFIPLFRPVAAAVAPSLYGEDAWPQD